MYAILKQWKAHILHIVNTGVRSAIKDGKPIYYNSIKTSCGFTGVDYNLNNNISSLIKYETSNVYMPDYELPIKERISPIEIYFTLNMPEQIHYDKKCPECFKENF